MITPEPLGTNTKLSEIIADNLIPEGTSVQVLGNKFAQKLEGITLVYEVVDGRIAQLTGGTKTNVTALLPEAAPVQQAAQTEEDLHHPAPELQTPVGTT